MLKDGKTNCSLSLSFLLGLINGTSWSLFNLFNSLVGFLFPTQERSKGSTVFGCVRAFDLPLRIQSALPLFVSHDSRCMMDLLDSRFVGIRLALKQTS